MKQRTGILPLDGNKTTHKDRCNVQLDISTQTANGTPISAVINAHTPDEVLGGVLHLVNAAVRRGMAQGGMRVKVWLTGTGKAVVLPIPHDNAKVDLLVKHVWALLAR